MQIEAAAAFQHSVQVRETHGHHRHIGHNIVVIENAPHFIKKHGELAATGHDFIEGLSRGFVPRPSIFEGLY